MDPALNGIIAPWAQLGIVGSVVLALGQRSICSGDTSSTFTPRISPT